MRKTSGLLILISMALRALAGPALAGIGSVDCGAYDDAVSDLEDGTQKLISALQAGGWIVTPNPNDPFTFNATGPNGETLGRGPQFTVIAAQGDLVVIEFTVGGRAGFDLSGIGEGGIPLNLDVNLNPNNVFHVKTPSCTIGIRG
jgi:hypothetical protein